MHKYNLTSFDINTTGSIDFSAVYQIYSAGQVKNCENCVENRRIAMALLTDSWKIDILAIFIGAITIIYLFVKRQYSYWDRNGFKTLSGYNFLVGHFKESFLGKKAFADFTAALYRSTNEPFIGIYGVMRPQLMVRDPELLRYILIKDFTHFSDRGSVIKTERITTV